MSSADLIEGVTSTPVLVTEGSRTMPNTSARTRVAPNVSVMTSPNAPGSPCRSDASVPFATTLTLRGVGFSAVVVAQ